MTLRGRAPLRVSFAGGGTDVSPFPETEGGAVLSATINRYVHGSLEPREDGRVTVSSRDLNTSLGFHLDDDVSYDGTLDLAKAAAKRMAGPSRQGYDLILHSSAPPGSGLGSSSTIVVALVELMREHHGLALTQYEVAQRAWEIERLDLGIAGGLQDHYAATFGGFNYIEFGERAVVNPLRIPTSVINELEMNLLLCYTGVSHASTTVISDQTARLVSGEADTTGGLRAQKELAIAMKTALLRGELAAFGDLLSEAWLAKKRLSPMISTPRIDEIYDEALRLGAAGGKVTGAGGGGHILFYCDFKHRHVVAERARSMGCDIVEFGFEPNGVTTWRA